MDKTQKVIARRLVTNNLEKAHLVSSSCATVVINFGMWLDNAEVTSRRQGFGRAHLIKERGGRKLASSVKQDRLHSFSNITTEDKCFGVFHTLLNIDVFPDGDGISYEDNYVY